MAERDRLLNAVRSVLPERMPSWKTLAVNAAILAIFTGYSLVVLGHLDRGIDVSDAGFYYNSILSYRSIGYNVTAFGAVWGLLPIPDSILAHRLVLFALALASSVYFTVQLFAEMSDGKHTGPRLPEGLPVATGAGLAATLYATWLPDPSYNAVTIVLALFLMGLVLSVRRSYASDRFPRAELIAAGFAISALVFVRPPTALMIGLIGAIFVLARRECRADFLRLSAYAVLGMAAFCLVFSLRIEPVWQAVVKLKLGFEAWQSMGFDNALPTRMERYIEDISKIFGETYRAVILGGVGLAGLVYRTAKPWGRWMPVLGLVLFLASAAWLYADVFHTIDQNRPRSERSLALSEFLYGSFLLAVLAQCLDFETPRRGLEPGTRRILGLALFVFLGQFAIRFGSSNSHWTWSTALYPVPMYAMICALLVHRVLPVSRYLATGLVALMVVAAQFAAWSAASDRPYRLAGRLSDQIHRVELRNGRSVLRVDDETAALLNAVSQPVSDGRNDPDPPVLIDLTGAMPMMVYHLNMEVPRTPWLIGGFAWSDRFFDRILQELDDETVCRAWLLYGPESRRAFDISPLEARGVDLEADFDAVATAWSHYPGVEITLLRPRLTAGVCRESGLESEVH